MYHRPPTSLATCGKPRSCAVGPVSSALSAVYKQKRVSVGGAFLPVLCIYKPALPAGYTATTVVLGFASQSATLRFKTILTKVGAIWK